MVICGRIGCQVIELINGGVSGDRMIYRAVVGGGFMWLVFNIAIQIRLEMI